MSDLQSRVERSSSSGTNRAAIQVRCGAVPIMRGALCPLDELREGFCEMNEFYAIDNGMNFISVFNVNHELVKTVGKLCPWREEALEGIRVITTIELELFPAGY